MDESIVDREAHVLFELYGRDPAKTKCYIDIVFGKGNARDDFMATLVFRNENNKTLALLNRCERGMYDTNNIEREVRFTRLALDIGFRFKGQWKLADQFDFMDTFRNAMDSLLKTKYGVYHPAKDDIEAYIDAPSCRGRIFFESRAYQNS